MVSRKFRILFLIIVIFTAVFLMLYRNRFFPQESTVPDLTSVGQKYESVGALATEVQIDYFKKYLGDSVFINYSEDRTQQEYVFVDDDFYVQAVTNSDGKVLAYAVTTRNEAFKPVLKLPNVDVVLGVTKFAELGRIEFARCYGLVAATAGSFYYESYYFGRPGKYQTYLLGTSDVGYLSASAFGIGMLDQKMKYLEKTEDVRNTLVWGQVDCTSVPEEFREKQSLNTYLVLASSMQTKEEEIKFGFGVGYNQVWLLNK